MALASSAGVWLFYVQHQFPGTYWVRGDRWSRVDAALQGSSYYALPGPLEWLTAHIGLHHIHHLDCRIPNYRLKECFDENPELRHAKRFRIRQSLACVNLKLWDEQAKKLVRFRDIRTEKEYRHDG